MPTLTSSQSPHLLTQLTQEDLGELKVCLPALNIISFRGPGESGGVSSSLEPMAQQLSSKVRWTALSGLPFSSDSQLTGFTFHQPQVQEVFLERHKKAAMGYLFPLLHSLPELANFDAECWRSFAQLNEVVATESLSLAGNNFPSIFWLHDYHMALAAPLISMQTGAIPCQFWHVPWPRPEIIVNSPIGKELVGALLANKVLGFHTTGYAVNFLNTVQDIFPQAAVDLLQMEVRHNGNHTKIVVMPLGLDFNYWQRLARHNRPKAAAIPKKYGLANQIILGVDRLDYSKGVLEKLAGLESFLKNNAAWHRRFHFVQLCQPPQSALPEFEKYAQKARDKVAQINKKYGTGEWEPLLWIEGQFEHQQLAAWYQAADVLAVTPLADGLNLIAKEFVACRQDEQGALILSKQAGSVAELANSAIVVNATDPEQIAQAIYQSLHMSFEEKRRRMLSMRHVVAWNQLNEWACGFLRQALTCNI